MFERFDPGTEVKISYPESSHVRLWRLDKTRRREIVIQSVRDLVTDPLSVQEFMRRPFLLRSRWLVKAFEPAINPWRQFYLGSTREFATQGMLRVGLYKPEANHPPWLYGRPFHPIPEDRRDLMNSLTRWARHDFAAALRVFADDRDRRCQTIGNGFRCLRSRIATTSRGKIATTFASSSVVKRLNSMPSFSSIMLP
jgi:hypothetical protein